MLQAWWWCKQRHSLRSRKSRPPKHSPGSKASDWKFAWNGKLKRLYKVELPWLWDACWTFKWTSFDCKTSNFSAVRFEVLNLAKWATTIGKTNAKRHPSMQSIRGFFIGFATSCGNSSQSNRWGATTEKPASIFHGEFGRRRLGATTWDKIEQSPRLFATSRDNSFSSLRPSRQALGRPLHQDQSSELRCSWSEQGLQRRSHRVTLGWLETEAANGQSSHLRIPKSIPLRPFRWCKK